MAHTKVGAVFLKLIPFFAILFVYESFRSVADNINTRVEYLWMPDVDKIFFGGTLPTITLQKALWMGNLSWIDYLFYIPYMLHFVLPVALVVYVLIKIPKKYLQVVIGFLLAALICFVVYILFPAAPPWMASNLGYIDPLHRISVDIWSSFGINDFNKVYSNLSPNAVAAVPSLHAAWATLLALYVTTLFKSRIRYFVWIYPLLIYIGTVYLGEHYVIDVLLGIIVAIVSFVLSPRLAKFIRKNFLKRIAI